MSGKKNQKKLKTDLTFDQMVAAAAITKPVKDSPNMENWAESDLETEAIELLREIRGRKTRMVEYTPEEVSQIFRLSQTTDQNNS